MPLSSMLIVIFVDVAKRINCSTFKRTLQVAAQIRAAAAVTVLVSLFRSFAGNLHGVILGHIIQGREKTV